MSFLDLCFISMVSPFQLRETLSLLKVSFHEETQSWGAPTGEERRVLAVHTTVPPCYPTAGLQPQKTSCFLSWGGIRLQTTNALSTDTKVPTTQRLYLAHSQRILCQKSYSGSPPQGSGPTPWCTNIQGPGGATVQGYLSFKEQKEPHLN